MMFHSKVHQGFSLVELMVVLAIMGGVMSLTGGLVVNAVNKHERVVELERVKQTFKKLSYNSFYTGVNVRVILHDNRLTILNNNGDVMEASNFTTLQFVPTNYLVSNRALVTPSEFSVINGNSIHTVQIPSVYNQYEE